MLQLLNKEYHFVRDVNSRDDIHNVVITVVPSYYYAMYDTGRVCYDSKNLLPLKQFKKELANNF